jgi:hypothetical protein
VIHRHERASPSRACAFIGAPAIGATNSSTKHSAGHQQRGRILAIAVHMWIL